MIAVGSARGTGREEIPGSGPGRQPRTFVPVESLPPPDEEARAGVTTDGAVAHAASISPATGAPGRIPGTWWLWGDPEPWPDL